MSCRKNAWQLTLPYLQHTLININTTPLPQQISKIVKRFKLSEKHLWRLKVQSLCRLGAHAALSKLAGEKKSPIGFKPFAVGCIKYVPLCFFKILSSCVLLSYF